VYATLMRAVVSLRPAEFLDGGADAAAGGGGRAVARGQLSPAQEHVVSVAARRVVRGSWMRTSAAGDAPVVLVTTVAGEQHEFGALMVSVLALDAGWRWSYLGTSLPAAEIVRAAQATWGGAGGAECGERDTPATAADPVAEVAPCA
jgi:MerR family transcriptional regulator, light-induced transcriptional regulator